MTIDLKQHMFTSSEKGFATVSMSEGISREEKGLLEKKSLYILPTALLYKENINTPIKYIYYPLNTDNFVIGKAIYIGKDNLNRAGNYFFHNLIINKEDFRAFLYNPVLLIEEIEKNKLFKNSLTSDKSDEVRLNIKPLTYNDVQIEKRSLSEKLINFISALFFCSEINQSVYLKGSSDEILSLLKNIYFYLPYEKRMLISFDTFGYGIGIGTKIIATPDEKDYDNFIFSYLYKYSLKDKNEEIKGDLKKDNELINLLINQKTPFTALFYEIKYQMEQNNWQSVSDLLPKLNDNYKSYLYEKNRDKILNQALIRPEFIIHFNSFISFNDFEKLLSKLNEFYSIKDEIFNNKLLNWISQNWNNELVFNFIMSDKSTYENIFKLISTPDFYLKLAEKLGQNYDENFELLFYRYGLSHIFDEKVFKKLKDKIFKAISSFKPSSIDEVTIIRGALIYIISEKEKLLPDLIKKDFTVINENLLKLILHYIFKGLIDDGKTKEIFVNVKTLIEASREPAIIKKYLKNYVSSHKKADKWQEILRDILLS